MLNKQREGQIEAEEVAGTAANELLDPLLARSFYFWIIQLGSQRKLVSKTNVHVCREHCLECSAINL